LDIATLIGIVGCFGIMAMAIMAGGPLVLFVDVPSLMIVVGGTIGATLIHYPLKDVLKSMSVFKNAFFQKETPLNDIIEQLVGFANKARKEGILSLQGIMEDIKDDFLLKGLQMTVDGQEPEQMKEMLHREIEYIEGRHEKGAKLFIDMGAYSPAMGMIGTLIGLVQMLQTMDDPSSIGPAMAVALLTTFYGAVLANVIFNPIAGKLKGRSQTEIIEKLLITEGMGSILKGENTMIMKQKLHAFIAPNLREVED